MYKLEQRSLICLCLLFAGGNLPLSFSRRSTHLVCPSGRGAKYDKAREWGVKVVDMEWLIGIATSGKIPPTGELEEKHAVDQAVPVLVDDKAGQGRESTEEDNHVTISDITNGKLILCSAFSFH